MRAKCMWAHQSSSNRAPSIWEITEVRAQVIVGSTPYFAKAVPLVVLGVYGIARTLEDSFSLLMQRLGTLVLLPKISASNIAIVDLRANILRMRRVALILVSIGLAGAVALSRRLFSLLMTLGIMPQQSISDHAYWHMAFRSHFVFRGNAEGDWQTFKRRIANAGKLGSIVS
jgi:hypothetical protein